MASSKFDVNSKVRVSVDGKSRLGRVVEVITGTKAGRRLYGIVAESNGSFLGTYRSTDVATR